MVAAGREDEVRRELGALRRFRIRVRDDRAACAQALRALSAVQDVDGSGSELTVTLHGDAEDDAMAVVNGVATQFGLLRSAPVDALEELFLTAVDRGGPR